MRTLSTALLLFAAAALAADKKAFLGQAGNDNIELTGSVLLEPAEIKQAVGAEVGPGFVVVRVKATPKTGEAMRIGPADFVLISRKDGDRSDAIEPSQIASKSSLTIKRDTQGRDYAQQSNTPGYTGVGSIKKDEASGNEAGLIGALKAKQLPDLETKGSDEGLVYFAIETAKLKSKDLTLLYKGVGGRLTMDFK